MKWEQITEKEICCVFDDIDLIVKNDFWLFSNLIQSILEVAPRSHILLTAWKSIGILGHYVEKIIKIKQLDKIEAIKLLSIKSPKRIDEDEMAELVGEGEQEFHDHHLFTILDGHPQAIALTSSLLKEKRLLDVYQILSKIMEHHAESDGAKPQNLSLFLTFEASLIFLQDQNEKAYEVLVLSAFCPSGIHETELESVWG